MLLVFAPAYFAPFFLKARAYGIIKERKMRLGHGADAALSKERKTRLGHGAEGRGSEGA